MILVKNLSSFKSRGFYCNSELPTSDSWINIPRTTTISKREEYIGSILSNEIYYATGLIDHEYIEFTIGHHKLVLDVDTPVDMIQYMECFYIAPITKLKEISKNNYEITTQGMIRLIYNGPTELLLQWTLSI